MNTDMGVAWEHAKKFAIDHWDKPVAWIAALLFTSFWTWFIARRRWKSRHDYDVMHMAQNTIQLRNTGQDGASEPWLVLDGNEDPLGKLITHPMAAKLIKNAAKKTTEHQPFLRFDPDDRWYVMNIVLLAIGEDGKEAARAKLSCKATVDEVPIVFAMTYERYPKMRQGKIRVMIVEQSALDDEHVLDQDLRVEFPSHRDRITTLRRMREDWKKGEGSEFCRSMRFCVKT